MSGMSSRGGGGFGNHSQQSQRESRQVAVFVVNEMGIPAPVMIEIGLSDWSFAEVLSGLEEGDVLALVGAAQLIQDQRESLQRLQDRMGGGNPFGGGGGRSRYMGGGAPHG